MVSLIQIIHITTLVHPHRGGANSAIKLSTARTINGVSFDGTANITITANPTANQLTNQNLNDYKANAFYYAGGGNTVVNKPADTDAFGLLVMQNATGYREQLMVDTSQKIAFRMFNSSAWGSWNYLYSTLYKPSKSDVGLANVENKSSATIRGELTSSNVTTALGFTPSENTHTHEFIKNFVSGTATTGYIKVMDLDYSGCTNANQPIVFHFGQRAHEVTRLTILTNNFGSAAAVTFSSFIIAGGWMEIYGLKTGDGKFSIYIHKAEAWDTITLYRVDKGDYMKNVKITYTDVFSSALPSGTFQAGWGENVNYASASGHVGHSLTIQTNGTTAASFNGSESKTVNITPSSIGASATSHTHNYLPLTGGSMTGSINISGKDTDTGLIVTNSSTGKKVGFTIGAANNNRGVFDFSGNKWMIYADSNDNVLMNGNASTATKLATARTISSNGLLALSATFDGSSNVTASLNPYYVRSATLEKNNYPWHRIASYSASSAWDDRMMTVLISGNYVNAPWAIASIALRVEDSVTSTKNYAVLKWLVRSAFDEETLVATTVVKDNKFHVDVFLKSVAAYQTRNIQIISGGGRTDGLVRNFTFYNSTESNDTTTTDKKTSVEVYTTIADAVKTIRGTTDYKTYQAYDQGTVSRAGYSNSIVDTNDTTKYITAGASKNSMAYADYTYLTGWNGYELRTVAKTQFATAGHTHNLSTMINTLDPGEAAPTDNDYYVTQYAGGGTTNTTYIRRRTSSLWSYIKGKADTVYASFVTNAEIDKMF